MKVKHQSSDNIVINQNELDQFMENALPDLGGAVSAVLVYVGKKLRYCKAVSDGRKTHSIARAISYDKNF